MMTSTTIELMPAPLRRIYEEVHCHILEKSNIETLRPSWRAYVSKVRQQIPQVHIEGEGEVLYLGNLSPGCRACKDGTWDCIFTTMRCNLNCTFCYSPYAIPSDYVGSAFGTTIEEISKNYTATDIRGISFSGGEPFVEAAKLFDWIGWFTSQYPDKYYWVYTNGFLVTAENLRQLGKLGLNEIRFNLAASDYDNPLVIKNLATAAQFIPNVTVEIPAIPEHSFKVLACLAKWCELGVRFLNLHEFIYEPGTNSASIAGPRQPIITTDGHRSEINPESRLLALAAMQQILDKNIALSVNDCSLQSKIRQLCGRRRSLAPLVQAPYEQLVRDEVYESCFAYRDGENYFCFHPESASEIRSRYPDYRFVRLARTAPLSIDDPGHWITFEET